MTALLYQWIDLIWIPIAMVVVHRGQVLKSLAFILACILTLRTQIEIMTSIGKPNGILGWLDMGLYERGLIIYGLLIGVFLVLAHFSPHTRGVIFLAATLSLYVMGLCVSMLAMVF
ncbi:hypothetical protein [Micavibrio aeruginosavorus]|uniref:Uncharacterized protein n=1 Tax=Micavibrio aeruginosavorus EPB TaxID=349215 RepID=M4VLN1_9BACT|nr:hypothetical protein [Micavibrio aeruginosavorus]AGH99016.1 hypothetical protein A11S_2220 [Micavibrio aeruginosavorus EPB]